MSDIKCPYCGEWQEINHDDGYGYDENDTHSQDCSGCGKEFDFTTSVFYSYSAYCKNESDHEMYNPLPNDPDLFMCRNCEHSELKRG